MVAPAPKRQIAQVAKPSSVAPAATAKVATSSPAKKAMGTADLKNVSGVAKPGAMTPSLAMNGAVGTNGAPPVGAPNYSVNSQPQTVAEKIQQAKYNAWQYELQQQQSRALANPPQTAGSGDNSNSQNPMSQLGNMMNGGGGGANGAGGNKNATNSNLGGGDDSSPMSSSSSSRRRTYQKYDSSFADSEPPPDYSKSVEGNQTLPSTSCKNKPQGQGPGQDYQCLVCNCFYEAEHEGAKYSGDKQSTFAGEVEVNRTVYTRVAMNRSTWGGNNICDVVWHQNRGVAMFSWTKENRKNTPMDANEDDRRAMASCEDAAKAAMKVKANGLPNYHAVWMDPGWNNLTKRKTLAGHHFYSDDGLKSLSYANPAATPKRAVASTTTTAGE